MLSLVLRHNYTVFANIPTCLKGEEPGQHQEVHRGAEKSGFQAEQGDNTCFVKF